MLKTRIICLNCFKYVSIHNKPKFLVPKINYINNYLKLNNFHTTPAVYYVKDYYEVLGISRNASLKEIKKAYYELAKRYHPDTNHGNADANKHFQEVADAYHILSDNDKRSKFDATQNSPQNEDWEGVRRSSFNESFHSSVDAEDMFRKIFGDIKNEFGKEKTAWVDFMDSPYGHAPSQEIHCNITFKEAAKGCDKTISVNVIDDCPKCNGSRVQMGYAGQTCPFCDGVGYESITGGTIPLRTKCRVCNGTGVYILHKCSECLGYGQVLITRRAIVPVPMGVKDLQTMRVEVTGNELFLTFHVSSSKYFLSVGEDIHTDALISLSQAVLGGIIKIEGLYSDVNLEISPGTDSHSIIKLVDKGMKRTDNYGYGDHFVHIVIKIPKKLSLRQLSLIKSFAELEDNTSGTINGVEKKINLTQDDYSARDENIEDTTFPVFRLIKRVFKNLFAKS